MMIRIRLVHDLIDLWGKEFKTMQRSKYHNGPENSELLKVQKVRIVVTVKKKKKNTSGATTW